MKERHLGYSYEVVDGADSFDKEYVGHTIYGGADVDDSSTNFYIEFPYSTRDSDVILAKRTKLKRVEDYHG